LHATTTWVGPVIVGLFSLLVTGHFFGKLTMAHAFLLFAAPLLAWLPEMPYVRRLPSGLRGLARVLLVAGLVGAVLIQAQRTFNEESSSGEDYMESGR
jgi:hypothetical protein